MKNINTLKNFLAMSALTLGASLASTAALAEVNFANKPVRFVIASTPSGPTDMMGRAFAPYIAKHLPGSPDVVVENRPGAVGVIASNWMYNIAPADGSTVGVLLGMVTNGLMEIEGVQYDPAGFNIVGAISATQVLLARNDLGLKEPKDLLSPAKPLVLASLGAGSTTDSANRLFLAMMDVEHQYVTGYPGQAETILALSQGEASLANASHNTYLSRRDAIQKEGVYEAFLQRGELTAEGTFRRNPQLPDIPTMVEAIEAANPDALHSADFATYRSIVGSMALHYSFVLPPKTPVEVVDAYRKAFDEAMADPETRSAVQAVLRSDYDAVSGVDADKVIQQLSTEFKADPRINERLLELMAGK